MSSVVRAPPGSPPRRTKSSKSSNPRYKGKGPHPDNVPTAVVAPPRRTLRQASENLGSRVRNSVKKGTNTLKKVIFDESASESDEAENKAKRRRSSVLSSVDNFDMEQTLQDIENLPYYERLVAKKVPGRLAIACTAVALIWLTSLGLIRLIVSQLIFPSPTFREVDTTISEFFVLVEINEDNHVECAVSEEDECDTRRDRQTRDEDARTDAILDSQDAFLENFEVQRARSKDLLNRTLQDFVQIDGANPGALADSTLNDLAIAECPRIARMIQTSLVSAGAISRQLNVQDLTNSAIEDIIDNFKLQQEFSDGFWETKDLEFVELNAELAALNTERVAEIQASLDARIAAMNECFSTEDCNGLRDSGFLSISNRFSTESQGDADLKQNDHDAVDADVDQIISIFGGIAGAIQSAGIPAFDVSIRDVDFGDFYNDFSAFDRLSETGGQVMNGFSEAANQAANNSADAINNFKEESEGFGSNTIEPYDPPVLDDSAQDDFNVRQDQRNIALATNIDGTNERSNEDNFVEPGDKQGDNTSFVENVVSIFDDREIEFFSYPADVFNALEVGFSNVFTAAIALDIIFRIVLTITTWQKYWRLSAIGKPPGDIRLDELTGNKSGTKKSAEQKLIDRLFHPAVLNLITMIFTVFIVFGIYALYSPFYDEFIVGCINNDIDTLEDNNLTGTMIFNNLRSAAESFAAQPGDSIITTAIDKFNNDIEINCEVKTLATVDRTEDQFELFAAINADYQNTLDFKNEIDGCINLTEIDQNFGTQTVAQMSDPSFSLEVITLESGVYNCNAIELCNIAEDCVFNDKAVDRIDVEAFSTSCEGEQFLHSSVFSFLLIFLIYVSMFIFRKNFLRALVRIYWEDLNPFDFTLLATCQRDGTHVDPDRVTQDGYKLKEVSADALWHAIEQWERESWVYMVLAFSVHVPWIFGAIYLREGFH